MRRTAAGHGPGTPESWPVLAFDPERRPRRAVHSVHLSERLVTPAVPEPTRFGGAAGAWPVTPASLAPQQQGDLMQRKPRAMAGATHRQRVERLITDLRK